MGWSNGKRVSLETIVPFTEVSKFVMRVRVRREMNSET